MTFDRPLDCFVTDAQAAGLPIIPVRPATLDTVLAGLGGPAASAAQACGFAAQEGRVHLFHGDDGLAGALFGLGETHDPFVWGALASALPPLVWALPSGPEAAQAAFGFAAGAYRFDALHHRPSGARPRLVQPAGADTAWALQEARSTWLVRDLVNMPASHLGPLELARIAKTLMEARGAHAELIEGAALAENYPAVAAVGAGSTRAPCVLHATWQSATAPADAPLVSLCGKGVCFDTGGYDIKPSAGMLRMKKDMGGAAIALGLACLIMQADLPIRLELQLGCAENMISGHAFRPSDVILTRSGLSVEVGNTDAEGRLVLCDLLTRACASSPDILLDFATLTGAARVALGPDLPAMFTNSEALARMFQDASVDVHDPVWRLPLWSGYNSWLDSHVADLNNVSEKAHAGAISAALFLQRFVCPGTSWAHFDVYAWNDATRSGRPIGGEAQAMRAAFQGISRVVRPR